MIEATVRTSDLQLSEVEEKNLIDGLNEQVWKETWRGNWPHLFTKAVDARDRAERIGYIKGLANAHLNLGQLYRLHSEPEKSEPSFLAAKKLFTESNDCAGLGSVWHQLGMLYMHRGSYERSIECTLEAREIWMKMGDEQRLATSYVSIANLYCALEQYDSAEEQYETAKAIYLRCNDQRGYARVLSNYARVAQGRKDEARALAMQLEAIEILQKEDQPINVAATYLNLGSTYCKLKQFDQAIAVLTTALEVADQNQYRRAQFIGRMYLAETFLEMKDPVSARRYFSDAEQFKSFSDLGDLLALHADIEASICAAEGNYKRAYELQTESAISRNKILSAHVQQAVATKSAHYKFEETLKKKEALRKQNIELQALNDHKDEILRIVSHDMRNPLGFIIGMGNLLKTEPESHLDAVQEIGGLIEDTGQRLLVLVNNLLNAARLEEGAHKLEKRSTDIEMMLRETEKLFGPLARHKNITLNFDSSQSQGVVNVDEPKLQQVISNVLSNSLKFTSHGGRIDVNAIRSEGHVSITIRDSGIGMDGEQLRDLFVKFSPSRRSGTEGEKGIGLGMTIIKQFVDLHNGSVSVNSNVDEGTSITITVPDL
ncbi:MAG TPA: ATP-binding protein [Candidatus Kapabacteria bacterium]|nr:ATP-binding protein [Candidatus Kapabacteria bacterium]